MEKVVFFGSGEYVLPILEVLKKQFGTSLIITTEKVPSDPVIKFAIENKIPYLSVFSFDENVKSALLKYESSLAILANFGLIIPKDILNSFEYGILNIHPSLLPKYRGATPGQTAILNGDKITGVSLMKLDEQMDHGPILAQQEEEIGNDDTSEALYLRLFNIGAKLIDKNIQNYIKGTLKLTHQDDNKATFAKPLTRQSGFIDFDNPPDKEILQRMIKAYFPWPGIWGELIVDNKKVRIKLLPQTTVQVEGKKPIGLKDFQNGYPESFEKIIKLF
jgi:methionyl-tRNA formyltransferase